MTYFLGIPPGLDFFLTMEMVESWRICEQEESSKLTKSSKVVPFCYSLDLHPDNQRELLCLSPHQGSKPKNCNESVYCIDQCPLSKSAS